MRTLLLFLLLWPVAAVGSAQSATRAADTQTGVISAGQIQALFPATVYFAGQSAPVQIRNASGVRWNEGKQTLFGLVDTGGYSSGVRERYQFYVLTDVAVEIGGKHLAPGAYGAGFLPDQGIVVMDLGGGELFHAPVQHDAGLPRPRPLQVIAGANGHYRLYLGRDFVEFAAAR